MNIVTGKQESVYDLIRSMSKAEKRNFKLYATRLSGNQEAKFISLFDCMDALDEYDETKILQRCPIKKEQLPNMKAHLYKQILVSIRLLDAQRTVPIQLREQIDFARILYDKGLFRQSTKILEKAKEQALFYEQYTQAIEIIEFQKRLGTLSVSRGLVAKSETVSRQVAELCTRIKNINELSNSGSQLYGLYLQLGYARTQKDLDMIVQVYGPTLAKYDDERQVRRSLEAVVSRAALPVSGAGMVPLYPARYADVLQIRLSLDTAVRQRAAHERADVRSLPAGILPAA